MPNILSGCRRHCSPDPCQNGALCVEKWNNYQCICTNKWAHSGHSCETSKYSQNVFPECSTVNSLFMRVQMYLNPGFHCFASNYEDINASTNFFVKISYGSKLSEKWKVDFKICKTASCNFKQILHPRVYWGIYDFQDLGRTLAIKESESSFAKLNGVHDFCIKLLCFKNKTRHFFYCEYM